MRGLVPLVGLLAACDRVCEAAYEPRLDTDMVSGVSVDSLSQALAAQPFATVPLEWRDGAATIAHASVAIEPGTAHRSQRPDCLEECHTKYQLLMECAPDRLAVAVRGTAWTEDGRVGRLAWTGLITATAVDGPIRWEVYSDRVAPELVDGTADWRTLAEVNEEAVDLGVSVYLSGVDGALSGVAFDLYSREDVDGDGTIDIQRFSGVGGTPD